MYIDTEDYTADQIFKDHDLHGVRYYKYELNHRESNFIFVACSIWTKDEDKFIECMEHLSRKIEFNGEDMTEHDFLCAICEFSNDLKV